MRSHLEGFPDVTKHPFNTKGTRRVAQGESMGPGQSLSRDPESRDSSQPRVVFQASLYSGIGTGSGVFVAQAFGRQDMRAVSRTAALGQILAAVFGICTALPLVLCPAAILRAVGAQQDLVGAGAGYFQLFAASMPMVVVSAVTTATLRSLSDSRTPMVIIMAAVITNTLLALLLVLGLDPFPRLGVIHPASLPVTCKLQTRS